MRGGAGDEQLQVVELVPQLLRHQHAEQAPGSAALISGISASGLKPALEDGLFLRDAETLQGRR
jgi:hypothetical protein